MPHPLLFHSDFSGRRSPSELLFPFFSPSFSPSSSSSSSCSSLSSCSSSPFTSFPVSRFANYSSSSSSTSFSSSLSSSSSSSSSPSSPSLSPSSSSSSSFPSSFSPSSSSPFLAHMDEEVVFSASFDYTKAMIAGSAAGVSEHLFMFPVDTIKTRMQAAVTGGHPAYRRLSSTLKEVLKEGGISRLYRGLPAVCVGAIPSHAAHFGTYEWVKHRLIEEDDKEHHPLLIAVCGAAATCAHDGVITPLDVVKQRLQLGDKRYTGVLQTAAKILRKEGFGAFYASYPTTMLMNIPFVAAHFTVYESVKRFLTLENEENGLKEVGIAGGAAGASAALVSTPFDVIKTRIQTQIEEGARKGAIQIAQELFKEEGYKGFLRGASARVLYYLPSSAICFTAYELTKKLLKEAY